MSETEWKEIKGYEGLYYLDPVCNLVYSMKSEGYIRPDVSNKGYERVKLYKKGNGRRGKRYLLHRLIYTCYNPDEDISEYLIDHIDGNPSNNDISNLRKATLQQNMWNSKVKCNSKTGLKNISYDKRCPINPWRVRIFGDRKKTIYDKQFPTKEAAIQARDVIYALHQGEFAKYD
jgi:hypothetical protein